MYGNLNSTVIGDWEKPKARLPGSGGANDFASFCWRILVITPQDPRRFVEKVSFITSPGYLDGPGAREKAGLPEDSGPHKVITNMAIMGYDPETKRMQVESIHRGFTFDDVQKNCGFPLLKAKKIVETPPPTEPGAGTASQRGRPRRLYHRQGVSLQAERRDASFARRRRISPSRQGGTDGQETKAGPQTWRSSAAG